MNFETFRGMLNEKILGPDGKPAKNAMTYFDRIVEKVRREKGEADAEEMEAFNNLGAR